MSVSRICCYAYQIFVVFNLNPDESGPSLSRLESNVHIERRPVPGQPGIAFTR